MDQVLIRHEFEDNHLDYLIDLTKFRLQEEHTTAPLTIHYYEKYVSTLRHHIDMQHKLISETRLEVVPTYQYAYQRYQNCIMNFNVTAPPTTDIYLAHIQELKDFMETFYKCIQNALDDLDNKPMLY